jgi:acyl carrier protein
MMKSIEVVNELRELIIKAAPSPAQALPVRDCRDDELLDGLIPFSSIIVLGVIIAIEDHFKITVTHEALKQAFAEGATLRKLAKMIEELKADAQL